SAPVHGSGRRQPRGASRRTGAARPQRAGETGNGTERLATSAEHRSCSTAFLFLLVWTSKKNGLDRGRSCNLPRWIRPQGAPARCLVVEPAADVRDRILVEASVKAARDVTYMRCCQQARQRAERMVERQRLLVEDIDGGAGDRLIFKRRNEIRLDHDRSARRVYQARRRLHECQFRRGDKAARPSTEHQMDRDDI